MEEAKEALKRGFKKAINGIIGAKLKIIIILIAIVALILLTGATYFITIDDGTYKEDDWSSTPYAAGQYTSSVTANSDGSLSTNIVAQELWDKMIENGSRVDLYLDSPEELARLMKAEIVTQYPDTRSNPDEAINWQNIIDNPDALQGIIKFKRADSSGSKSTMVYTDPATFQSYVDEYNSTGSDTAKQKALSHFTLKQNITTQVNTGQAANPSSNQTNNTTTNQTENQATNQTQTATVVPASGDGYSEEYTSSAGITYKHFKQFEGSYANNAYWNGTIHSSGCGPTSVAILASGLTNLNYTPADTAAQMMNRHSTNCTSSIYLKEQMDSIGLNSEITNNPTAEQIKNNLKNGKVMLVSVNSNTIFTGGSHIMALVDINTQDQVYICNPGSRSLYGWYDVSEIMKGCNYIVTTDAGVAGIANNTNNSNNSNRAAYSVMVATWRQVDTTITTNDPNVTASTTSEYYMTTTDVNYEKMVEKYTMPFDFLWALLVVGEDKNFVFEIADLIYGSDIQITIHDNLTVNTNLDEWKYTKQTKAIVDATVTASYSGQSSTKTISNDVHDPHSEGTYTTTKSVVTQTNIVNANLTKANVWLVDSEVEYKYASPEETSTTDTVEMEEQQYPENPSSNGNTYSCSEITTAKNTAISEVKSSTNATESDITTSEIITANYYDRYKDISDNVTSKISTKKYVKGTSNFREKVEPEAMEDNFVTIFNKGEYRANKANIKSAADWLFEILETNESTADMVDLMKYLLYKSGVRSYYVEGFNLSGYDVTSFTGIDGDYGEWDGNGTTEDFIAAVAPYAVIDMEQHQIYASVTIAQAIIESGWGKDNIAVQYKNFFGMKVGGGSANEFWSGDSINLNASEGGVSSFRVYDSLKNSIYDHGRNFHVTATYGRHGVLDCIPQKLGPKEQLRRIAISGYAVYSDGSISKPDDVRTYDVYLYEEFIQKYDLEKYDKMTSADFEAVGNIAIVETAKTKLGCAYVWGATGPNTFDCSGLVKWVYEQNGISVPRSTINYKPYLNTEKEVSWDKVQPGDILWIHSDGNGHVGIYIGNDQYIHAPQPGDVVKISSNASSSFTNVFRFSK